MPKHSRTYFPPASLPTAPWQAFLQSDSVSAALNKSESVLAALTVLKKICDHPGLLSAGAAHSVISGSRNRWEREQQKGGKGGGRKGGSGPKTRHGYDADDDFIANSSDDDNDGRSSEGADSASDDDDRVGASGTDRSAAGSGRATAPLAAGGGSGGGGEAPAGGEEEWMKLAKASVVEDKLLQVRPMPACSLRPSPHTLFLQWGLFFRHRWRYVQEPGGCIISSFSRSLPLTTPHLLCPLPPCRRLSARVRMPPARACLCWRCWTSWRPMGTAPSSSASHA